MGEVSWWLCQASMASRGVGGASSALSCFHYQVLNMSRMTCRRLGGRDGEAEGLAANQEWLAIAVCILYPAVCVSQGLPSRHDLMNLNLNLTLDSIISLARHTLCA